MPSSQTGRLADQEVLSLRKTLLLQVKERTMVHRFLHLTRYTFLLSLLALAAVPVYAGSIGDSYHGQLGYPNGTGMLEKWCALPNFSFDQQGGIEGWSEQSCNDCHVGAEWNPARHFANCYLCHQKNDFEQVAISGCMHCHSKDTAKRGDLFTPETDVHIAAGMLCQDCHLRVTDNRSDHQFLKGSAIDTTEPTMEGTLSCTRFCHSSEPHGGGPNGDKLDQHTDKVACETCHTGARPSWALESRSWNVFDEQGMVKTTKRSAGWFPQYKWYDNTGPGPAGAYDLPILGHSERRDVAGARIYPFNEVTVDWFVKESDSAFDDVIIVPEVKAADADGNGTVTVEEMQKFYPGATLLTRQMNFSISHSVLPKERALNCNDCHGSSAWVFDWSLLGYSKDPGGEMAGKLYRRKN